MVPVDVLIKVHDPENGQYGDCHRACIASLLNLFPHQVPHFMDGVADDSDDSALKATNAWLGERGLCLVELPIACSDLEEGLNWVSNYTEDAHYMLIGESRRGVNHSVICHKNRVVHDPTYGMPHGIKGPSTPEREHYWIGLIVKL